MLHPNVFSAAAWRALWGVSKGAKGESNGGAQGASEAGIRLRQHSQQTLPFSYWRSFSSGSFVLQENYQQAGVRFVMSCDTRCSVARLCWRCYVRTASARL